MERHRLITHQVFKAIQNPALFPHFFILLRPHPHQDLLPHDQKVDIILKHPIINNCSKLGSPFKLEAIYPLDYPESSIAFSLGGEPEVKDSHVNLATLILFLAKENNKKPLDEILLEIIAFLNSYMDSQHNFQLSYTSQCLPGVQHGKNNHTHILKSENYYNAFSESEDVRLMSLLGMRLRELLKELQSERETEIWVDLEKELVESSTKMEGIQRILFNHDLYYELNKEIKNGRFLYGILKSTLGLRSKKVLIKNYGKIIYAIQNPESLIHWRNNGEEVSEI